MIPHFTDVDFGPPLPDMDPVRKFVVMVLWQGQRDQATELVIDQAVAREGVPIRYLVEGTWYGMAPLPEHLRAQVAQTIIGMTGHSDSVRFPVNGEINERVTADVHLQWHVAVAAPGAPVHLHRSVLE